MATSSMCDVFKTLKKADDWMSAADIAFQSGVGKRWCRICAGELVKGDAATTKTIDRRKYYRLTPCHEDSAVVIDINESMRITSK